VRIGISLMYWPWFAPQEQLALAEQADRLGLHSVWVAEGYGQEAAVMLGLLAGRTDRILLGAGILQIPARQPTTAAMVASTVDRLSGGRMLLGLGLSGPQVSEGWYGVPFTAPLRRTREYVEIVRLALSGQRVAYDGAEWSMPARGGLGHRRRLDPVPVQPRARRRAHRAAAARHRPCGPCAFRRHRGPAGRRRAGRRPRSCP
jgi:alkanesulfonate monooxygenase SsuD/methylene tetrahydromethanopterin reductase-like flavin-dependent oxidoreductase (luciferase family)